MHTLNTLLFSPISKWRESCRIGLLSVNKQLAAIEIKYSQQIRRPSIDIGGSLPVLFSPSALTGANGESGTDRERLLPLEQAEPVVRIHSAPPTSHCEPLSGGGKAVAEIGRRLSCRWSIWWMLTAIPASSATEQRWCAGLGRWIDGESQSVDSPTLRSLAQRI